MRNGVPLGTTIRVQLSITRILEIAQRALGARPFKTLEHTSNMPNLVCLAFQ